eukprot:UN4105
MHSDRLRLCRSFAERSANRKSQYGTIWTQQRRMLSKVPLARLRSAGSMPLSACLLCSAYCCSVAQLLGT